jgi:uncharacterized membrane protein YcaP (DUF421 family)
MMFTWDSSLLLIVLRTLVIYIFFVVGLRLVGLRALGQATVIDLALLLLISNAVQNAMVGSDYSVDGGLISALTLLIANLGLAQLIELVPALQHLAAGEPAVLIRNGHVVVPTCARERVLSEELEAAIREHGMSGLSDVKMAVLEPDGSISVVGKDAQPVTVPAQVMQERRRKRRLRGWRRP